MRLRLLPVAGVPDVAATLFAPLTFDPDGAVMRRAAVGSVDPDVAVAIPAVIAGNPDVAFMRGDGYDLHGTWGRRANADDDLRVGGANGKEKAAGCNEKLFLHGSFSLGTAPD